MFSHNGAIGPESIMILCFIELAAWQHHSHVR